MFVDEKETCSKGDCETEPDKEEEAAKYQKPTDTADDLNPCPSPPPKLGENIHAFLHLHTSPLSRSTS